MTREEAITVLKGLSDNPLFSDAHKAAFNIAIHDIKAHHDWDINNLILINKDNYEPLEQEPFINKPCVSEKVCEHDKNEVLDKIDEIITDALDKSTDQKESQTLRWVLDKISEVEDERSNKSQDKTKA